MLRNKRGQNRDEEKLMKLHTRTKQALCILTSALILAGCAGVGGLLTKDQTFSGTDSMVLDSPRDDILDVIAAVGKSMQYDVSGLDKNFDV